jgi:hypothetical protein
MLSFRFNVSSGIDAAFLPETAAVFPAKKQNRANYRGKRE